LFFCSSYTGPAQRNRTSDSRTAEFTLSLKERDILQYNSVTLGFTVRIMSSDELKALAMSGDFAQVANLAKSSGVVERVVEW
jgi:hypothetical protein